MNSLLSAGGTQHRKITLRSQPRMATLDVLTPLNTRTVAVSKQIKHFATPDTGTYCIDSKRRRRLSWTHVPVRQFFKSRFHSVFTHDEPLCRFCLLPTGHVEQLFCTSGLWSLLAHRVVNSLRGHRAHVRTMCVKPSLPFDMTRQAELHDFWKISSKNAKFYILLIALYINTPTSY